MTKRRCGKTAVAAILVILLTLFLSLSTEAPLITTSTSSPSSTPSPFSLTNFFREATRHFKLLTASICFLIFFICVALFRCCCYKPISNTVLKSGRAHENPMRKTYYSQNSMTDMLSNQSLQTLLKKKETVVHLDNDSCR